MHTAGFRWEAGGGAEESRGVLVGRRLSGGAGGEEAVLSTCRQLAEDVV